MYARGEIGAEAFKRLRALAQAGELSADGLRQFRARRAGSADEAAGAPQPVSEPVLAANRQLQARRGHLEAACAETEESIQRLELEAAALLQEAESPGADPELRTHALSRAKSVDQRIEVIRERLSDLKTQLADVAIQERLLSEA